MKVVVGDVYLLTNAECETLGMPLHDEPNYEGGLLYDRTNWLTKEARTDLGYIAAVEGFDNNEVFVVEIPDDAHWSIEDNGMGSDMLVWSMSEVHFVVGKP
jgi:hypothetical protein